MKKPMDKVRALEAEARAIRRREKAFWAEVDKRIDEVEEHILFLRKKMTTFDEYVDEASQSTDLNFI